MGFIFGRWRVFRGAVFGAQPVQSKSAELVTAKDDYIVVRANNEYYIVRVLPAYHEDLEGWKEFILAVLNRPIIAKTRGIKISEEEAKRLAGAGEELKHAVFRR